MTKEKMAIIKLDDYSIRFFVNPDEIVRATFDDFEKCNWTQDDMGLVEAGKNEDGDCLFTSADFDGEKTWDELKDIETDFFAVNYWDGNNHQVDVFENYDIEEIEIEKLDPPSPAYYFPYILTLKDGEKVNCTVSNTSGSLSPYFEENEEEDY